MGEARSGRRVRPGFGGAQPAAHGEPDPASGSSGMTLARCEHETRALGAHARRDSLGFRRSPRCAWRRRSPWGTAWCRSTMPCPAAPSSCSSGHRRGARSVLSWIILAMITFRAGVLDHDRRVPAHQRPVMMEIEANSRVGRGSPGFTPVHRSTPGGTERGSRERTDRPAASTPKVPALAGNGAPTVLRRCVRLTNGWLAGSNSSAPGTLRPAGTIVAQGRRRRRYPNPPPVSSRTAMMRLLTSMIQLLLPTWLVCARRDLLSVGAAVEDVGIP